MNTRTAKLIAGGSTALVLAGGVAMAAPAVASAASAAPAAHTRVVTAPRHGICDAGWLCHPVRAADIPAVTAAHVRTGPSVYYHTGQNVWVLTDGPNVYYHT